MGGRARAARRAAVAGILLGALVTSGCSVAPRTVTATLPAPSPTMPKSPAPSTSGRPPAGGTAPGEGRTPPATPPVQLLPDSEGPLTPVLGRTPGDYAGRISVTGDDPAGVHRQLRAAMVAEMRRVLTAGGLKWWDTDVRYGRREAEGTSMLRALYLVVVDCPASGRSALVTPLTKAGYAVTGGDEAHAFWRGRRGDIDAGALTSSSGRTCGLTFTTPYVPYALDLTQFSVHFDGELDGEPPREWPADLGVETEGPTDEAVHA